MLSSRSRQNSKKRLANFSVTILKYATFDEVPEVTLPVETRVQLLKDAINQDILNKKYNDKRALFARITPVDNIDIGADYEYEEEGEKLTPILDNDKRKIRGKNALKLIKSRKTTPFMKRTKKLKRITNPMRANANLTVNALTDDNVDVSPSFTTKKKNKRSKRRPPNLRFKDIFYRRYLSNIPPEDRQFLHCIDLLTPFMRGHKRNMTDIKRIPPDAGVVVRLIQLLNEATVDRSKDDIRSIMYQISNLQIRLFQWEISSMNLLLFALSHEKAKSYSFKNIKYGLKRLFESWQLDLSNTTSLLKQARIFRPPCMLITPNTGSTKSPSSTSFTLAKPKRVKVPCLEYSKEQDRKECAAYYY